jgi:hypothetical protein
MYIGYIDESGFVGEKHDPNQPVQVMACVLPSVYNLGPTLSEYAEIMDVPRKHHISARELKAQQIYSGGGPWKGVRHEIRHALLEKFIHKLSQRPHRIILSVIDNGAFFERKNAGDSAAVQLGFPYVAGAMQIACAVQRFMLPKSAKERALLIFDQQAGFEARVQELIASPLDCLRPLYKATSSNMPLTRVVDTAYFIKSHYSPLIQTADVVAFVSRLYFQLTYYGQTERFAGERQLIEQWFQPIKERAAQSISCTYPRPSGGNVQICQFYQRIAPSVVPKCFRL